MPNIYIIAGPNGAGKTTAAQIIFPETLGVVEFVNADEIAKGLSPFNWDGVSFEAGRIMLKRIHHLLAEQKNFAFETTLSAKSYLGFIKRAKKNGYNVALIYLWLIVLILFDDWFCFDNSNGEYELIAKKSGDGKTIVNFEIWKQIQT